jgi:hypothetical protein
MFLVSGEMTASTGYNIKVGVPETLAKRIMRQLAVRTAVWALRAKMAQQNYLIGNY